MRRRSIRIGILDDTHGSVGGGTLVPAYLAASLARGHTVELIHGNTNYNLQSLMTTFGLDLGTVTEKIIPMDGATDAFGVPGRGPRATMKEILVDSRSITHGYDLFVYCGIRVPPFCYAKHGVMYIHFPLQCSPVDAIEESARWEQRNYITRFLRKSAYQLLWQVRMHGYRTVIANSRFTAEWVEHRWGRAAEVVPPPVDLDVPSVDKKNIIVTIGRFCGSRKFGKNQLEQVSAFAEFLRSVGQNWGIYIIGSCYSEKDQEYVSAVQKAALGLPVTLLVNASRDVVCRTLATAKFFWNTKGLEIDELETPEEVEHFGIATVEAMRARCVPVVIASGGQRGIIQNGVNGFLVNNLAELVQTTAMVSRDEQQFLALSSEAWKRSMDFSGAVFERRMSTIFSQYLPVGDVSGFHCEIMRENSHLLP